MVKMYASLQGKRVRVIKNVLEWADEFEDKDRRVAETILPNGTWVSTVFLGINHAFLDTEKPLWFETMVFSRKGDYGEWDMARYSTWGEAVKGHKAMVKKWTR